MDTETAKQVPDKILSQQAEALQKTSDNKNRQLGNLQTVTMDAKHLKDRSATQGRNSSEIDNNWDKRRNDQTQTGDQDATKATDDLAPDIRSAVDGTIQRLTPKWPREQAIHRMLHKKGKALAVQAKTKMMDSLNKHCHKLRGLLTNKTDDDTFYEASSLLNQAVMKMQKETRLCLTCK
jgi:uncharacterized phage infection (PIP) family protein YhgE